MTEGDVVLTPIPQADGVVKARPALLLRTMPPFGDFLACGISTQTQQAIPDFDEVLRRPDADFASSGLVAESVVRLGFLGVVTRNRVVGAIGSISRERHERLLLRLSAHLSANVRKPRSGV